MMKVSFTRGRSYRSVKIIAGPWHVDLLVLKRSQRDSRLFARLPAGHGWRISVSALAVQAYRPDRFTADRCAAMA